MPTLIVSAFGGKAVKDWCCEDSPLLTHSGHPHVGPTRSRMLIESDPFSPSWRTRDFADWRTSQRRHTGRRAPSSAIFQAPNLEGHPMLNAGYHAVPPGMIATVVTSLEMLELPTLRPEAPDRNWRLDRLA